MKGVTNNMQKKDIAINNKYNWYPIKIEYVEGYDNEDNKHIWPTMKELAQRHSVPPVYLRKIASENKWTDTKKAFLIKYEQMIELEHARQLAKRATNFDKKCIDLAEKGIKEVQNILLPEMPLLDENGCEVKYTLNELELAAKTLDKFQKIGRLSLGISNTSSKLEKKSVNKTLADALDLISEQMTPEMKSDLEKQFIGNDD